MLATVDSCLLVGMEGRLVEVQADAANGEVKFFLIGLASTSVKEARDRVKSAIGNSGMKFPRRRITVNLAPPEMPKSGGSRDLAIAAATPLADAGKPPPARAAFLGELALDGTVRHIDGVLVAARRLRGRGYDRLFVPESDAREAALVDGLEVIPCAHMGEVAAHLLHGAPIAPASATPHPVVTSDVELDLLEVHGQDEAKRALEIAAAGDHHVLMSGPPGAGKTMLARCLPGILPPLPLDAPAGLGRIRGLLAGSPGQGAVG